MDEMVQDVLEGMDEEGIEEEADMEVGSILFELTNGLLGQAGSVGAPLKSKTAQSFENRLDQLNSI